MDYLQHHLEAIIFCSQQPVEVGELRNCVNEMFETSVPLEDINICLDKILEKYDHNMYPFQVFKIGGGYQFLTKPAYQASIGIHLKQKSKKRLTTSAMETLAIIAYKQPISKGQLEQIRGVNCDYAVHRLLEKELIELKGKADTPGKPVLYGTSDKFMDYFGINAINELPTPKDFSSEQNEIGVNNES